MTNYEKIKQMTLDELAKTESLNCNPYDNGINKPKRCTRFDGDCYACQKSWLKQEAEE